MVSVTSCTESWRPVVLNLYLVAAFVSSKLKLWVFGSADHIDQELKPNICSVICMYPLKEIMEFWFLHFILGYIPAFSVTQRTREALTCVWSSSKSPFAFVFILYVYNFNKETSALIPPQFWTCQDCWSSKSVVQTFATWVSTVSPWWKIFTISKSSAYFHTSLL